MRSGDFKLGSPKVLVIGVGTSEGNQPDLVQPNASLPKCPFLFSSHASVLDCALQLGEFLANVLRQRAQRESRQATQVYHMGFIGRIPRPHQGPWDPQGMGKASDRHVPVVYDGIVRTDALADEDTNLIARSKADTKSLAERVWHRHGGTENGCHPRDGWQGLSVQNRGIWNRGSRDLRGLHLLRWTLSHHRKRGEGRVGGAGYSTSRTCRRKE